MIKEVRVSKESIPVKVATSALISLNEGKRVRMTALGLGGLVLFKAAALLNEWSKDNLELKFIPGTTSITDKNGNEKSLLQMEIMIID